MSKLGTYLFREPAGECKEVDARVAPRKVVATVHLHEGEPSLHRGIKNTNPTPRHKPREVEPFNANFSARRRTW